MVFVPDEMLTITPMRSAPVISELVRLAARFSHPHRQRRARGPVTGGTTHEREGE